MRHLTVEQLHEVVGGRLRLATLPPRHEDLAQVGRIVTDSRQVAAGDVFWGLVGPNHDGAAFADEAYTRGAAGVVTNRYIQPQPGRWSLEVADGLAALTQLAAWNRRQFGGRVVAVTGSVGKTTTREMIAAALGHSLQGTASPKNFNNHIGVPLSLLNVSPEHDFAVLELAANKAGEIAALTEFCQPHVGVITRIGQAHLAGFGSQQGVAEAKTELLSALDATGHAVLSGEDPWLRRMADRSRAPITWVGRSLDCDLAATNVRYHSGLLSFDVCGGEYSVRVWGRHHLDGALAAVAVGRLFGLSSTSIAAGLASFVPQPMRCEIVASGDATIINDAYNASPSAMRAALELLRDFDAPGRRIVVCGDMRDLGGQSRELHVQLGNEVVTHCGADLLFACGEHAADVVAGAVAAGMSPARAIAYWRPEQAVAELSSQLGPGDVMLVKGSRALGMERLVAALTARVELTPPNRSQQETLLVPSMV